jgi:hypothetical protein
VKNSSPNSARRCVSVPTKPVVSQFRHVGTISTRSRFSGGTARPASRALSNRGSPVRTASFGVNV